MSSPQQQLLQNSLIKETKQKFDSFLKTALQQKLQMNPEETKTKPRTSRASLPMNNEHSEEENKEFILNKFFEASNSLDRMEEVKPIPKPRTKLKARNLKNVTLSPLSSSEAFRVNNTKEMSIQKNIIRSNTSSESSTNTYKVSSPKVFNIQDDDLSSQRTFRVSKNVAPKIGDIIIHEKDSVSKLVEIQVKNETEISNTKGLPLELGSNSSGSENIPKGKEIERNSSEIIAEEDLKVVSDTENSINRKHLNEIISIVIHRTDKLMLNSLVIHPVVKIHIVDMHTGSYYSKKNKERSVVYYYEDNLDYIAPVMTSPYDLQEKRSLIPLWEEKILINEDYEYIIEQKDNIIMFFEILDFVSVPVTDYRSKGWHKIAFAFLKISGKNNGLNLNKKMRLQLYYYSPKKGDNRRCSIWETWYKRKLEKYPSSLYVSVTNSSVNDEISTGLRSLGPMEKESFENSDIFRGKDIERDDYVKNNIVSSLKNTADKNMEIRETAKNISRLPNECLAQFETEKEGCFTLRFSNSGSLLACGLKSSNVYCIVIFSVVSFTQVCYLPGHQDLIYSICWSADDSILIACSADCSVSVWDITKVSFLQILPHPNFVYANDISSNLIATGCYDKKLRIWQNSGLLSNYILSQELEGHNGYITSLLFKKTGNTILSSDSVGVIIVWYQQSNTWILHKRINILGLEGIVINQVVLISKEKRLLVHSRDNILRILDLESSFVMHWLQGGLNTRFQTSCSVSPCEKYIIAGSENSCVNIWKAKTGKYVGSLFPYKNKGITIHALQFSPKNDMIAVGHFGKELPVLLFGYNEMTEEINIDLRLIADNKSDVHKGSSRKCNLSKISNGNFDFKNMLKKLDKLIDGNLS